MNNAEEKWYPEPPKELDEAKKEAGVIPEGGEILFLANRYNEEVKKSPQEQDKLLIKNLRKIIDNPDQWQEEIEILKIIGEIGKEAINEASLQTQEIINEKILKKINIKNQKLKEKLLQFVAKGTIWTLESLVKWLTGEIEKG